MSEVVLTLGVLVKVADGIGDREHLGFLGASQEPHPLLGVEVLIMKAVKVLYTQQWWEHPAEATGQHMQEETSE